MSSLVGTLGPEDEEVLQLEPDSDSTQTPTFHVPSSSATHLGIYGSYRLLPGLTTLTCKCAEKDTELVLLRSKHEEAIAALTKGHADIISHLTADFENKLRIQAEKHNAEKKSLEDLLLLELENRLYSAFRSLDSSWAKQKALIIQEHSSLVDALRSENEGVRLELEADRAVLEQREKAVTAREQDIKSSKKTLSKNVQKRRAQLQKSRLELSKLQSVLSLVSQYQVDCLYNTSKDVLQIHEDSQEQAQVTVSLAQEEAKSIVEAAQNQVEELMMQAQASAEEIISNAERQSAAFSLEDHRRSPTLSDVSTSAYSLRSFESLPILEESPSEGSRENESTSTPNSLSRRASFDATRKKRAQATKRKPIPFGNGLPSEFGLESVNPQDVPGFSRGQRRRTTSSPLSDGSTRIPHRKRDGKDPLERSKLWRPY